MPGLKHESWQGFTLNEKGQKRVCAAAHSMSTILGKGVNCVVQEHFEPFKSGWEEVNKWIKWEGMKFTCLVISTED